MIEDIEDVDSPDDEDKENRDPNTNEQLDNGETEENEEKDEKSSNEDKKENNEEMENWGDESVRKMKCDEFLDVDGSESSRGIQFDEVEIIPTTAQELADQARWWHNWWEQTIQEHGIESTTTEEGGSSYEEEELGRSECAENANDVTDATQTEIESSEKCQDIC
ncbi:hypothetical protein ACA910_000126 [Epithemia clementina (nom. ined.)]